MGSKRRASRQADGTASWSGSRVAPGASQASAKVSQDAQCHFCLFCWRGLFTGSALGWSPSGLSGFGVFSRVVAQKAFCLAGPEVFSKGLF